MHKFQSQPLVLSPRYFIKYMQLLQTLKDSLESETFLFLRTSDESDSVWSRIVSALMPQRDCVYNEATAIFLAVCFLTVRS